MKIAMDLDSGQHAGPARAAYDVERTVDLESPDLRALRFWTDDERGTG